jgi:hypothetical protein
MEWNGKERNGTEQNGTEWNGMERNGMESFRDNFKNLLTVLLNS